MRLLVVIVVFLLRSGLWAQDIKPLDFASVFGNNKVSGQVTRQVSYGKNATPDTLLLGVAEFELSGRMIRFTEYFAGGRVFAVYRYFYDEAGQLSAASVAHTFLQFEEVPFILTRNATGQLISRTTATAIPGFWTLETYTYNARGVLVRSERWIDQEGRLNPAGSSFYPDTVTRDERVLSDLYDNAGLPVLKKMKDASGNDVSILYSYTFY
jgi:hypothetical protein